MLLRFSASNYRSIADKQELSLVATQLKGPDVALFPLPGTDLKILPGSVVYGANASGKSNLVRAFRFMRSAVLYSHTQGAPEGGVPRIPFLLDSSHAETPTECEADFVVGGVRYQYGFVCDDQEFLSEWLYAYPEGKRRKLFERSGAQVDFGSYFKGQKKLIAELMRPNSLFISTATQNDHEELSGIAAFFRRSKVNSSLSVAKDIVNNTFKKGQIDRRTIAFLASIGTGIIDYRQVDIKVPDVVRSMITEFQQITRKHLGEGNFFEDISPSSDNEVIIEFAHASQDGEKHYLGLEHESAGTRRLILVMNLVFRAIDQGSLIIIDELDASLHTLAADLIVRIFSDREINKSGAQLIATTHDTNLLNSASIRRDQIWFCEKDRVGSSHLFPLSEIRSRQGDNFERGYLEGRYGAIPCSADLSALFRE